MRGNFAIASVLHLCVCVFTVNVPLINLLCSWDMYIKFSLRVGLFSNFKLWIFYYNFQHKMPFYDWLEIVLRKFITG